VWFGRFPSLSYPAGTVGGVQVEVIRSARRRRTVQARLEDGVLQLLIPARLSKAEEQHWIEEMTRRFQRKAGTDSVDLPDRARRLALRYRLPQPQSIRWVDNQLHRWGSCTPADGAIRISSRLAAYPGWVLDYVIVHELAHLVETGHGKAFDALTHRYPKAERAIGFLMAKGIDGDDPAPRVTPAAAVEQPALFPAAR
jgi:predicted metal-dependent hydrolase